MDDVSILDKYIVSVFLDADNSGPDLMHLNEKKPYAKYVESLAVGDHTLSFKLQMDLHYKIFNFFTILVMEVGL